MLESQTEGRVSLPMKAVYRYILESQVFMAEAKIHVVLSNTYHFLVASYLFQPASLGITWLS